MSVLLQARQRRRAIILPLLGTVSSTWRVWVTACTAFGQKATTLVPVGSRKYVFTLAGDKAKRVEVETGRRKPGYVEVTKGLKEGQVIITDGLVGLLDGALVKVTADFKAPSEAFNPEEDR